MIRELLMLWWRFTNKYPSCVSKVKSLLETLLIEDKELLFQTKGHDHSG